MFYILCSYIIILRYLLSVSSQMHANWINYNFGQIISYIREFIHFCVLCRISIIIYLTVLLFSTIQDIHIHNNYCNDQL